MTRRLVGLASALAAAGLAGAASLAVAGSPDGWFGAGLAALAVAIAIIDVRAFRIPDALNAALFALGLVAAGSVGAAAGAFARGLVMAGLLYGFRWLYGRIRAVEGVGLGDVKLAAGAGVWLQATSLAWVVELAAVSGLLFAIVASRVSRFRLEAGARLPFGAFLAPAIWLCWLLERLGWL